MKKILSIALVVIMLLACVPFSANAAAPYGYGWQWSDSEAYGYIQNIKHDVNDVVMEFDMSISRGAEGGQVYWYSSGGAALDPKIDVTLGTACFGTTAVANINWGEMVGTNWHRIKLAYYNGTGTLSIDGNVVVSAQGVSSWRNDSMIFMANHGIVTIDDVIIAKNDGTIIAEVDFEDSATAKTYFGGGLGGIVELVSPSDPVIGPVNPEPKPDDPIVPDVPVTGDVNKVMRIDGYAAIAKEIKKCDDYPVYNYGTVEFDLWMLPGSSGAAKFELFESYEGSVRPTITNNAYGYSYTWTEYEELHGFSWGSLSLDNMRHFKMEHDDEQIKLYMDDQFLTSIPYGTTPAMPGLVFYVSQGYILIDNLVFTDSEGTVHGNFDFDTVSSRDNEGDWSIITLGDCATYGHVAGVVDILKLSPNCTEQGYSVRYCAACGQEASRTYIPALGHSYGAYSAGKVTTAATATEDGVIAWACGRCGLDTAKGVKVATGDYAGNIISFDDFSDFEVTQYITGGFPAVSGEDYDGEYQVIEDGNAILKASTDGNYHQFLNEIDTKGFTVSFDFRFDGLLETNDSDSYGHNFHFWFGGSSIINNQAGYDFENQEFFIKANAGEPYAPIYAPYEIEEGKWYNLTFKYYSNTDTFEAWCAMYVNGEQVIIFDDIDAAFELPYDASRATAPVLFRTFGVEASYDNYVIGDADFEWINFRTPENVELVVTPGDLNGDGGVNAQDSILIKKLLIGAIDMTAVNALNADVNGDGVINAKDSRAIKVIILGK